MTERRASTRSSGRLAAWRVAVVWVLAASGLVAITLAQFLNPDDVLVVLILGLVVASFALVGAIVVTRLPGNLIGWLLWGSGAVLGWATAGTAYALHSAVTCGGCLPATVPIAVVSNAAFGPCMGVVALFIPLLFPNGRPASRRWRPVVWFSAVSIALLTVSIVLAPGPISGGIENPLGVDAVGGDGAVGPIAALTTGVLAMVGTLASVVWRFRHADRVQRQQLKWFGYAALLMVIGLVVGLGGQFDTSWVVMYASLGLVPIAIGIAVLRYRLYEIDRLVSRTIGWAIVTGVLATVFAALVVTLEAVLAPVTNENTLAVAASTLVAFALFQPVRRRVQRAVDRRFDRARYDGERTVSQFAGRLRDQVDLNALEADIAGTVATALRPSTASLWIRASRT